MPQLQMSVPQQALFPVMQSPTQVMQSNLLAAQQQAAAAAQLSALSGMSASAASLTPAALQALACQQQAAVAAQQQQQEMTYSREFCINFKCAFVSGPSILVPGRGRPFFSRN